MSDLLSALPTLAIDAGPSAAAWPARLKEELQAVIALVKLNKQRDAEWFTIAPAPEGRGGPRGACWIGRAWTFYKGLRYEVAFEVILGVGYPTAPMEILVPELEYRTVKMYRGGRICTDSHFEPAWQRNSPHWGIAHGLALGLAPWLAVEVPLLADAGALAPR